jgi:hypothetical protein
MVHKTARRSDHHVDGKRDCDSADGGGTLISQIAGIGIINGPHDVGGLDRGPLNQTFPFPEDSAMEG